MKMIDFARMLGRVPKHLYEIENAVRDVGRSVDLLRRSPAPPPAPPPPFVHVIIMGDVASEDGDGFRRIALGDSRDIKGDETFTFTAHEPVEDATVLVFCDVRAVQVTGIFLGIRMVMGLGRCPLAYLPCKWEPGVLLRVLCSPRSHQTFDGLRGNA